VSIPTLAPTPIRDSTVQIGIDNAAAAAASDLPDEIELADRLGLDSFRDK
jgi:hypothetical protein